MTVWTDNPCQNFRRICIEGPPNLSDQEIDDIIELWKNQKTEKAFSLMLLHVFLMFLLRVQR